MDPALLKERESFKKRAWANPVVESKKKRDDDEPSKKKIKKEPTTGRQGFGGAGKSSALAKDPLSYKTLTGTSQYNFSVLAKIVKYMKQRHLDRDNEPLTLEDILDETNQLDIGPRQRNWLETEALKNNPKVGITDDEKYFYKPTLPIKDRKSLIRLLDKYDQRGLGGISLEDVQESLPNADKIIKQLADNIVIITRPVDKKKILFYKEKIEFKVDEEFTKLWRSVAVDGIDEQKIEEYLVKQGITSMQDVGVKKVTPIQKRKKPSAKKPRQFKKHNDHMASILQDYTDKT